MLMGLLRELNLQYAIHRADEEAGMVRDSPYGRLWPESKMPPGYNEDLSSPPIGSQARRQKPDTGPVKYQVSEQRQHDARLNRLEFLLKQLRAVRYRRRHASVRTSGGPSAAFYEAQEARLLAQIERIKESVNPYMYLDEPERS
jgi:hypothetical protein